MMILKFLAIVFFLYYASNIVIRHKQIKNKLTNTLIHMKESILETQSTYIETQEKFIIAMKSSGMIIMPMLLVGAIKIIYMICIIKYDPYKYICKVYLVFWILMYIREHIQRKERLIYSEFKNMEIEEVINKLDEAIEDLKRFSMWNCIHNIADLLYFSYSIYILLVM